MSIFCVRAGRFFDMRFFQSSIMSLLGARIRALKSFVCFEKCFKSSSIIFDFPEAVGRTTKNVLTPFFRDF